MIEMLKSKIHRATVTDANLNYEGSITICSELMEAANIREYEKVSVVNLHNGNDLKPMSSRVQIPTMPFVSTGPPPGLPAWGIKSSLCPTGCVLKKKQADTGPPSFW